MSDEKKELSPRNGPEKMKTPDLTIGIQSAKDEGKPHSRDQKDHCRYIDNVFG
jgi:hypothetical protein